MDEIAVLDHGFVRLDGLMVDLETLYRFANDETTLEDVLDVDLSVVNSARVSFAIRKRSLDLADEGLIKFLMREHHGTPFEHNAFRFHIKAPICVFREWQRHRIGSFNELSARYKEFDNPDFYVPATKDWRTQVGKPGAYTFEKWKGNVEMAKSLMARHFQDSVDLYRWYIDEGIAKEIARGVLPVYLYSEMFWSVNARSLMNFCNLRNSTNAMHEIREYAKIIEATWASHMPRSYQAFVENGRISP